MSSLNPRLLVQSDDSRGKRLESSSSCARMLHLLTDQFSGLEMDP